MFSFPDAFRALDLEIILPLVSAPVAGFSIDTRTLQPGQIFIALQGEKSDGHDFLKSALERGAWGAMIQKAFYIKHKAEIESRRDLFRNLILCEDALQTLTDLAALWRDKSGCKVIALTGSIGKTSTKDFLAYLLSLKFNVHSTQGNFNNHIGLPLTLLKLQPEHEFTVAELGASHVGEIRGLCQILQPDSGLITMIAPAHLEGFGSLENVYEAKLELFQSLKPGAFALLQDEDSELVQKAKRFPIQLKLVGTKPSSDYYLTDVVSESGWVSFKLNGQNFQFPSSAAFLARNAAMAAAMADLMGFSLSEIPNVWSGFKLPQGRFEEIRLGRDITLIYDGYNANPGSFEKAVEAFDQMRFKGRKILVISDMLELGDQAEEYHEKLGLKIAASRVDSVVAYGKYSSRVIQIIQRENPGKLARHFDSAEAAGNFLKPSLMAGDALLLKASRGMRIDKVADQLKQELGLSSLTV